MRKRLLALCLALCLAFSLALPAAAREETLGASLTAANVTAEDIAAAQKVIDAAMKELPKVAGDDFDAIVNIFSGFMDAASLVAKVAGSANSVVTFLKLIGVMKDTQAETLANINRQLQDVRDTLADMERQLNAIADTMNKMEADTKFRDRAQDAVIYKGVWRDFAYRYMEDGLDSLMTQYNGMLLDGLRSWCRNQNGARIAGDVDNTQLLLLYAPSEDGWQILYTAENGIPADFPDGGRWLRIPAELLPETLSWNVDTWRARLESYIADGLRSLAAGDGYDSENFPAFGGGAPTEEDIARAASDAADLLVYRVACAQVNENPGFALDVKRQFTNYCAHLGENDDGLRALIRTFYLTHAFEYEVRDDLTILCNEMIFKTGTYGAFVTNVVSMSDSISSTEKTEVLAALCGALNALDTIKGTCLTGLDRFCYITNTEVSITEMTLQQAGTVQTDLDGSVDGYLGFSMGAVNVRIRRGSQYRAGSLVGDTDAMIIMKTLQSYGETLNADYAAAHLFEPNIKNYGTVVTSLETDLNLPLDGKPTMITQKVIGDFFTTGARVGLNNLPGDATSSEIKYHRMSKGSVIDLSGGTMQTGRILLATAVYGEGHWYWWDDESAFFAGPADGGNLSTSFQTTIIYRRQPKKYEHSFTARTTYNCLVSRALSTGFGSSPLQEYGIGGFYTGFNPNWDDGTVIQEPTCTECGVILYRDLDDPLKTFTEELEPLGHDWDEGVVIREPGERERGIRLYTCQRDPEHTWTEAIEPTGDPAEEVGIITTGLTTQITGDWTGLYARVSMEIEHDGRTGLFLLQGEIQEDGTVALPSFRVRGVRVRSVSVALVRSPADITSPAPEVVASDFEVY